MQKIAHPDLFGKVEADSSGATSKGAASLALYAPPNTDEPGAARRTVYVPSEGAERRAELQRSTKHGGTYWIYADVHIAGVVIRGVLASPAGVAWPTRYGESIIAFTDSALQQRAESVLKQLARREKQRHRLPSLRGVAR